MTDEIKPTEPDVTPGLVPDPADAHRADEPVARTEDLHSGGETVQPDDHRAGEPSPDPVDLHNGEGGGSGEGGEGGGSGEGGGEKVAAAKEPRFDRRMIGLGVASGAVLIVLVLLALMVFAPGVSPVKVGAVADAQRAAEERAVERVAARFASSLYTFNYRTIDADLERIRSDATGSFSRELSEVLGEVDLFKEAIVDARGESVGQVQGVDVRRVAGDTASARVFVLQAIRNRKSPEPRQQVSMVELTLVNTSGGWKVDDVQQLAAGAPGAPEAGSGAPAAEPGAPAAEPGAPAAEPGQ